MIKRFKEKRGHIIQSVMVVAFILAPTGMVYAESSEVPMKLFLPATNIPIEILVPEVKTGDDSNILLYIVAAAIALAVGICVLLIGKRKKTKKETEEKKNENGNI